MKRVHFGPWVGEFGWELCIWSPYIRRMAKKYGHVIVSSRPTSRYLYEFADEFIGIEAKSRSGFGGSTVKKLQKIVKAEHFVPGKNISRIMSSYEKDREGDFEYRCLSPDHQIWVADVMFAFRSNKKQGGREKSYKKEECGRLVELFLKKGISVACYGGRDNYWFEGTVDIRGAALEEQCSALSVAKCAIGPSSGTIHLASLCKCPHIVWFGLDRPKGLRRRYEENWNPFKTSVVYLKQKNPAPQEVLEEAIKLI